MYRFNLKGIEVYHGSTVCDNTPYIEHFKARGKDVEHFLRDVIGRDKRYLIDSEKENSFTMALQATEKLLRNTGVSAKELDMIIFSSQLPEYVAPPSSIKIHYAIGGKEECICYDMNVNCIGMSAAVEHTAKYMAASPNIKYALIVGCDYINMTVDPENEINYGHYGDAACAILLERTQEDCGLVDSRYNMRSVESKYILFPACGFSKLFTVEDREKLRLFSKPFEVDFAPQMRSILQLLDQNGLTTDDISMFCFTQYAYQNFKTFRSVLNIGEEKSLYIGDEYGYTGTSSPFIVLYESMKRGLVKKGDYVVIWTVSAGSERITLLLKI